MSTLLLCYHKISKICPGACIFQRPLLRGLYSEGLSTEGNVRFKIDLASLVVGSKFTVFALFYFVFEGNFPSTSPRGAYIWRGDLTEGFLCSRFEGLILILEGLIHGGAYFRNFTVSPFGLWSPMKFLFFFLFLLLQLQGTIPRQNIKVVTCPSSGQVI